MDLVLTLDYELFGDGSGDIFKDVINPTYKLLDSCDNKGIKLTIFFEVVEYWKLKEEWINGNTMGYSNNPILAMEEQMIFAYQHGHDIQLHIHPQWINAKYREGKWEVDEHWSMHDIPLKKNNQFDVTLDEVFKKGMKILENMIKPIDENYKCNIFRAGGFNILPSENIIRVLKKNNFVLDSSVFSGGYENSMKSNYDYTKISKDLAYWNIKEDNVLLQSAPFIYDESVIELPIFSYPIYRILKYDLTRLKSILNNKKSAIKTIKGRTQKKNILQKILFYFEKESLTWDFCLFNSSKMKKFYNEAKRLKKINKFHPFVLIGHSKGYHSDEALEFLSKQKNNSYYTMTEIYNNLKIKKVD